MNGFTLIDWISLRLRCGFAISREISIGLFRLGKPEIAAELSGILERMAVYDWSAEKLPARIRARTLATPNRSACLVFSRP